MQQDYVYQALDTLRRGGVIEIYPEARFPITKDHKMQPFKTSYIILAAQSGAPIIPCYHKGNYGLFQRTRVAIGKPIYTKDFFEGVNPTIEQINKMNDTVFQKMLELQTRVE
ncbi:hypothetical protein FACS1894218_1280 [Bacilli bacterium]|nr:hypothetical protein FACS1894218_1280 [Bacilli bacterium]